MSELPKFIRGSDTSYAAARSIAGRAPAERVRIVRYMEEHGDCTCDELEVALNSRHQSCSARVRELVEDGRIYDTGDRRPTRTGRTARIYALTPTRQHGLFDVVEDSGYAG